MIQNEDFFKLQRPELVQLIAERYTRASSAMSTWAEKAKQCVDMTEGDQWTQEELRVRDAQGRPSFVWNKIGRLVRLVLGYHRNNRSDTKYLPGHDGTGTDQTASALSHLAKHTSEFNQEPYIDAEVMMDGIITGRGFYDARLDWEHNDFGDLKLTAKDPFSIKIDPDAEEYDLNQGNFVIEDRWTDVDEIAFTYGTEIEQFISPLVTRGGYAGMPASLFTAVDAIMPWRTFGGRVDDNPYTDVMQYLYNAFDPYRKNIKIVDCQHYVRVLQRCFVDLETGNKEPIPESWDDERIKKVLAWSVDNAAKKGKLSSIRVQPRKVRRVRWTTMVGDIIVYDNWSPYETFTMVGYFPWFRRGKTRGMVEDLVDPQRAKNKHRNDKQQIIATAANTGWKYHSRSMTPDQKEILEREGSAPGVHIEWDGEPWMEPKRIEPGMPPTGLDRLEQQDDQDMMEISGINEAALGDEDVKVQSGRALEAKQRQAVISVQIYMDNNSRTKELLARKKLEVYQNHYNQPRIVSVLGDNGALNTVRINQRNEASGEILNNVMLGRYRVDIAETPLSSSFISAQFDEIMAMIEKGVLPKEIVADDVIDLSSLPRKDILKKKVMAYQKAMGLVTTEDIESGVVPAMPGAVPGAQPGIPGAEVVAPPAPPLSITNDASGQPVSPTGEVA